MLPELNNSPVGDLPSKSGHSDLECFIRKRLAEGSEELNDEAHRELDRILLPLVMEHTRGNQFQAAKILGVARQTLRRRLRELNITLRFSDGTDDDQE
jgi:two-component system nitrogen regulation response regulator GlnG